MPLAFESVDSTTDEDCDVIIGVPDASVLSDSDVQETRAFIDDSDLSALLASSDEDAIDIDNDSNDDNNNDGDNNDDDDNDDDYVDVDAPDDPPAGPAPVPDVRVVRKRQDYRGAEKLYLIRKTKGDPGKDYYKAERQSFRSRLNRKAIVRKDQLKKWKDSEAQILRDWTSARTQRRRKRLSRPGRNTRAPDVERAVVKEAQRLIDNGGLTKKSLRRLLIQAGKTHQLVNFGTKKHFTRFRLRHGFRYRLSQRVSKLSVEEVARRLQEFHSELYKVWEAHPDLLENAVYNGDEAGLTVAGGMLRNHHNVYVKDAEGNIVHGEVDGLVKQTVLDDTKRIGTFFPFWNAPVIDQAPERRRLATKWAVESYNAAVRKVDTVDLFTRLGYIRPTKESVTVKALPSYTFDEEAAKNHVPTFLAPAWNPTWSSKTATPAKTPLSKKERDRAAALKGTPTLGTWFKKATPLKQEMAQVKAEVIDDDADDEREVGRRLLGSGSDDDE